MRSAITRGWLRTLIAVALGALAINAQAQRIPGYPPDVYDYDPRETALLPSYCRHTQAFREVMPGGDDQQAIRHWEQIMGADNYLHMHHYCLGLMHLNRARILARDTQTRNYHFSRAIGEIDYVLRNARHDFFMRPEMLTRRGEALVGLKQGPRAVADFEAAIAAKPDYWPAYAQLSDFHRSLGDLGKAREVLEAGLKHAPDSKGLRRRLEELEQEMKKPSTKGPGR